MIRPFILAGAKFRPTFAQLAAMSLKVGDFVDLMRDPFNEHDPNAVQVIATDDNGKHHIGFVPKEMARDLSPMLLAGVPFSCKVAVTDPAKLKIHFVLEVDEDGPPVYSTPSAA